MKKTTVYIDIEDDIATIIEKLENATDKIVAMVLPKRPSALQSSVNIRLLKKSADDSGKNLVLVSNDEQITRLAGQSGIYIAETLQSKPFVPNSTEDIPVVEEISDKGEEVLPASNIDPAQPEVFAGDKKIDLSTPVGKLTGDDEDEIELDNVDIDENADKEVKPKKKLFGVKGIKVPNFNKFRVKLVIGVLVVLGLAGGLYWALVLAPKAQITLVTTKSEAQAKVALVANTAQTAVDTANGLLPAVKKEDKQKLTGTFKATGQKDVGNKATGTMNVTNCIDDEQQHTIPAGTSFSSGSLSFVSTEAVTLEPAIFSGSNCRSDDFGLDKDVPVVATSGGDNHNLSARSYTASISGIQAYGSAMSGGTTKLVTVVSQSDVEAAKNKVLETAADNVKGKLTGLLQDDGLLPIPDTYATTQGQPTPSIAVDSEATTDVTLTIEVTSSMLGVKITDAEPLVNTELEKQINKETQKIYNSGLTSAVVAVTEKTSPDNVKISVTATASIGPKLDPASVASEIAGKGSGEAKQYLEAKNGVSEVDILLTPFWVFNIPKDTSKITVTINE